MVGWVGFISDSVCSAGRAVCTPARPGPSSATAPLAAAGRSARRRARAGSPSAPIGCRRTARRSDGRGPGGRGTRCGRSRWC
eukprot:scaffold16252_cov54-Phaeocystis_antarctica.AAC.2